ncbi:MAG TPA: hypothetical protein VHX86_04695 [Tepidisphaeraceae bacterium]|jgi:hypothetical protein|nr:hypothetical protein [Tepidisphaeraceae bacterium]
MQGVTAVVVGFIFLCLAMPSLVKNKNQYYVALICIVAVIFLDAIAHMMPESAPAPRAVFYVMTAFAQIIAIVMLVLCTGGLTFRELKGDMIEVLRRGETEKEIIIPLSDEAKKKIKAAQEEAQRRADRDEKGSAVFTIGDTEAKPPAPAKPPGAPGPLPLE